VRQGSCLSNAEAVRRDAVPAAVAAQPIDTGRSCQVGNSGAESAAVLAVGATCLRQTIAGLELVQALTPAPDLDGCAITERLLETSRR
jgi:hypothetical protein